MELGPVLFLKCQICTGEGQIQMHSINVIINGDLEEIALSMMLETE